MIMGGRVPNLFSEYQNGRCFLCGGPIFPVIKVVGSLLPLSIFRSFCLRRVFTLELYFETGWNYRICMFLAALSDVLMAVFQTHSFQTPSVAFKFHFERLGTNVEVWRSNFQKYEAITAIGSRDSSDLGYLFSIDLQCMYVYDCIYVRIYTYPSYTDML